MTFISRNQNLITARINRRHSVSLIAAGVVLICTTATPAAALTVFDPKNFSQNLRQVAEDVKAFYQRHEQTIELIKTTISTAAAVQGMENGNYMTAVNTMASLTAQDTQGAFADAKSAALRTSQLVTLANNINSPEDALKAAKLASTLTQNVLNDSAQMLQRLEPLHQTTTNLQTAMLSSRTAVGQTAAVQAQTQVAAIQAGIQARQLEIARYNFQIAHAERQKRLLEEAEKHYLHKMRWEAVGNIQWTPR